MMVGKWRDERDILYISTEFKNELIDVPARKQQVKIKPLPVAEYNKHMSGSRSSRLNYLLSLYQKNVKMEQEISDTRISPNTINCFSFCIKKLPLYAFRLEIIRQTKIG